MKQRETVRVCCLGPEATYSHAAALACFGAGMVVNTLRSVPLVFQAVEQGAADYGVVPAENSIEGSVGVTLDSFKGSSCLICAEIRLLIEHQLLGTADSLDKIKTVYSHPQALGQCRDWIARHLPHADVVPTPSTAVAAGQARTGKPIAAIGGRMLAERHKLKILARNIQDCPRNITRFWIIRLGKLEKPTGSDLTSLRIALAHRPGSLFDCLQHFAGEGVNLTRIESRPCPDTPFCYTFFLDVEGHPEAEPLAGALRRMRRAGHDPAILGAYPRNDNIHR